MSQELISHSPDLRRLQDEGYEIEAQQGFLLVHHVPYVNQSREIKFGTIICQLNLTSNTTLRPHTHVTYFIGEHPCDREGTIIFAIQHSTYNQDILPGIFVNFMFSNKPSNGYDNYYDLIKRYIDIISAPAKSLDESVTEKTFRVIPDFDNDSVFQYLDTNSSRSNIIQISNKLSQQKIGIIGLGGTGAYVLDFISKCPVKLIRLIDGDLFLQHNAFRTPGAVPVNILDEKLSKVQYYSNLYSNLHKRIESYPVFISSENISLLDGLDFCFISIDSGSAKETIFNYLLTHKIPFIDVGIGLIRMDDSLLGSVRTTTITMDKTDHFYRNISINDNPEVNEYNTNVQIVELNALNAAFAVIKWKKICGFYNDLEKEHNSIYSINVSQLLNNEHRT